MSDAFLKLAVIGDPVEHSKSPSLHTGFLAEQRLSGSYEAIQVSAGEAAMMLVALHADGYLGLNVTTPLKEEVLSQLVSQDPLVDMIGAANTLIATPDGWHGANTDGIGVCVAVLDRLHQRQHLEALRILVLGTGPTARAAVASLSEAKAKVSLWSRSADRAASTAASLGAKAWSASDAIDVVVATLPPNPELPDEIVDVLERAHIVIDANYGPRATLQHRLQRSVHDGRLMLEAQARASFLRWTGEFGEGEI